MEVYDVQTRPEALQDLEEIVTNLSKTSFQTAIEHHDLIVEKIDSLSQMPRRYPKIMDSKLCSNEYRTMYMKNYVVIYVVRDNKVIIRRILYAKSQYEKILIKQEEQ